MTQIKDGIINLNKPAEWTSHDCVAVLRGVLGIKRIGHTGTLDPMATGVLPVCIGPSTRIMEYLDLDFKTYECQMKLGLETDTLDIWGAAISKRDVTGITESDIRKAFIPFIGNISQIPPKYSALKVNGRKLYQYARDNEEVEIKSREVYIKDLSIDEISLSECVVSFTVTCSKGTYIRSICRDIGERLGCGASMSGLTRIASGIFSIKDSIEIEKLRTMSLEEVAPVIQNTDYPLTHFGRVVLNQEQGRYFCNGGHLVKSDVKIERYPEYSEKQAHIPMKEEYKKAYNMYMKDSEKEVFLGVAFDQGKFVADKVFHRG